MNELVASLRARAMDTPVGEWIQGGRYDDTLLAEQRHPTRDDFDAVSTDHQIYIRHTSGHLSVANSLALELAELLVRRLIRQVESSKKILTLENPMGSLKRAVRWLAD